MLKMVFSIRYHWRPLSTHISRTRKPSSRDVDERYLRALFGVVMFASAWKTSTTLAPKAAAAVVARSL